MTPVKINNLPYNYEVYLSNDFGRTTTAVQPNAIIHINIQEDLHSWHVKGEALIQYGYINKKSGGDSILYNLRNDGYDLLMLRFFPPQGAVAGLTKIFPDWGISKVFAIYDIEEVMDPPHLGEHSRASVKLLKIKFHDFWYQILLNSTIPFSTAEISTNANRSAPASKAIYELFKRTLIDFGFNSRFQLQLNLDEAMQTMPTNEVFFTAPTNFSAAGSIDYLNRFMTLQNSNGATDVPLLVMERGKPNEDKLNPGFYTIKSLGDYFSKAGSDAPGDYQIERYFIREFGDEKASPADQYFAPDGAGNLYTNYTTNAYHLIKSYELVDMNPIINAGLFTPITVTTFDFSGRNFNINTYEPEEARDLLWTNCGSHLKYVQGAGDGSLFVPFIGDEKRKYMNRRFSYFNSSNLDSPIRSTEIGLKDLMKTGLFQSTALFFKTVGLPNRKPGRFIGVDYHEGTRLDDYSAKLCGQWFVVQVNHIIDNAGAYWNNILAVRFHRSAPPSPDFARQQNISSMAPNSNAVPAQTPNIPINPPQSPVTWLPSEPQL
jgi:hypothetical protein